MRFSLSHFVGDQRGQAIAEFVLVFPVQLFLTLGIIQFALIFVAVQATHKAAYAAARAALVAEGLEVKDSGLKPGDEGAAKEAAARVLAAIAGQGGTENRQSAPLANWGDLERYGAAFAKTQVTVLRLPRAWKVTLEYDHELMIPVIGDVFAGGLKRFPGIMGDDGEAAVAGFDMNGYPHLKLTRTCVLDAPWMLGP